MYNLRLRLLSPRLELMRFGDESQNVSSCIKYNEKVGSCSAVSIFVHSVILVCPQNSLKQQSFWKTEPLGEPPPRGVQDT